MIGAVIVAGGEGVRFGRAEGKQLAPVAGRPLVAWALGSVAQCADVDALVCVCHPERLDAFRTATSPFLPAGRDVRFVGGGTTRQASAGAGIAALPDADVLVVHDGARPLVTPSLVCEAVAALEADGSLDGVVVGHPAYDTLKAVAPSGVVEGAVDRSRVWVAQTPQVFRADSLREAYAAAVRDGFLGTDDASLVERSGGRVRMLLGPRDNVKVTVPEDLDLVEAVLRTRGDAE